MSDPASLEKAEGAVGKSSLRVSTRWGEEWVVTWPGPRPRILPGKATAAAFSWSESRDGSTFSRRCSFARVPTPVTKRVAQGMPFHDCWLNE